MEIFGVNSRGYPLQRPKRNLITEIIFLNEYEIKFFCRILE